MTKRFVPKEGPDTNKASVSQTQATPQDLRAWEPVACGGGVYPPVHLIGPLRRFWALSEERIILASALTAHLRKRTNAQRLGLSTCKTGALPLSYGPMLTCA